MFFSKKKKKIIGRLERVDIPLLDLKQVTAKIDTGAYRGAIHVSDVKEIEKNGIKILQFQIVDDFHPELKNKVYELSNFKKKKFRGTVTNSHDRYIIPIIINIAGEDIKAELSLSDRSGLRYPILIGRRALKNKFLVDVDNKHLQSSEIV